MSNTILMMLDLGGSKSGNTSSSFAGNTNATYFDSNYSSVAFDLTATGSDAKLVSFFEATAQVAGTDKWMHCKCYVSSNGNTDADITQVIPGIGGTTATASVLSVFQENDVDSMVFAVVNDAYTALTLSQPLTVAIPFDVLFDVDIRQTGAATHELYINGVLSATVTSAAVDTMSPRMDNPLAGAGSMWVGSYYSELHVTRYPEADNVGSIGSNILTLYPVAEDTPNEWTGVVTSVNSPLTTDGQSAAAYTGTTGQTQMFTMDDISGTLSSRPVGCFATVTRAKDTDAASNISVVVDSGGSTPVETGSYDDPLHFFYSPVGKNYNTNSLTSAAWTHAEINALKIGFTTT